MKSLVGIMWIVLVLISGCSGNPDAKRLYDDLLSNYNKLVRPVVNVTDALTVKIKLKLSQLIDVNLKNQIMTTNLWVEQVSNLSTVSTVSNPSSVIQPEIQSKSRGPMATYIDKVTSFSHGGRRHNESTDALLFMIAIDKLPLATTERKRFKEFVKALQPLYYLPCEKTIVNMMEKKYENLQRNIKTVLESQEKLVLTTDLWTESMTTKSYIGLTAHYLGGIEMKTVTIGAKPMPERNTTENLSAILTEICSEWAIKKINVRAVISDNGANVAGACKKVFGEKKHMICLAHDLNIVVTKILGLHKKKDQRPQLFPDERRKNGGSHSLADNQRNNLGSQHLGWELQPVPNNDDSEDDELHNEDAFAPAFQPFKETLKKIKKIVGFFRRSERATEELKKLQMNEWGKSESECLKLIQEVITRWNSMFLMLDRFLYLCEFIGRVLSKVSREKSSKEKHPSMVEPEEEEIAKEVRDLLATALSVTQQICSEKSVTLSQCIPLVALLRRQVNSYQAANPVTFNLKYELLEAIDGRFGKIEKCQLKAMATILDPRFKKIHFRHPIDASNAVKEIGNEIKAQIRTSSNVESETLEAPKKTVNNNDIWSYHDDPEQQQLPDKNKTNEAIDIEISQYLRAPVSRRSVNPFEEWITLQPLYPNLYKMAMKYLPILATSVPSKRLFSRAGQIITKQRNRLSGQHLNMLIFLSSIDYETWRSV